MSRQKKSKKLKVKTIDMPVPPPVSRDHVLHGDTSVANIKRARKSLIESLEVYIADEPQAAAPPEQIEVPTPRTTSPLDEAIDRAMSKDAEKDRLAMAKNDDERNEFLDSVQFGKHVEILAIPSCTGRILCYFLNTSSVKDIQEVKLEKPGMVGLLIMEVILRFMENRTFSDKKGKYKYVGELNFHQDNLCPCETTTWKIDTGDISFTSDGLLFFENDKDKNDNLVFQCLLDNSTGLRVVRCYSKDAASSKAVLAALDQYTREHNCLRGQKIRDIRVLHGQFGLVTEFENYTWDNYYYPEHIQNICQLEIMGFLDRIETYRARGIHKRGCLFHGVPGTGKTTLGKLICKYSPRHTILWVTPDLLKDETQGENAIRAIYSLADYLTPACIVLEDIDLYSEDRDHSSESLRLGSFLNVLDGVNSVFGSVTVAMTNRLDLVEKALQSRPGRFDRVVEIPPFSDISLRKRMITDRLSNFQIDNNDDTLGFVLDHTDGYTGAQMQEFINSLNMYYISNDLDEKEQLVTIEIVKRIFEMMGKYSVKGKEEPAGFDAEK